MGKKQMINKNTCIYIIYIRIYKKYSNSEKTHGKYSIARYYLASLAFYLDGYIKLEDDKRLKC